MNPRTNVVAILLATSLGGNCAFGQNAAPAGLQQPTAFAVARRSDQAQLMQPERLASPAQQTAKIESVVPPSPAPLELPQSVATASPPISVALRQPSPFSPAAYEHPDVTAGLDADDDVDYDGSGGDCEDYGSCRAQNFGWYSDGCCAGCYDYSCCDTENWYWGGWIEQGITFNGYDPADGFNGVVGLNDFANQWQMNQLWLYTEKCVDATSCSLDVGGKVDAVFGTDGEFMQMEDGLEESWGQTGQYQFALMQFYLDFGWNDWELIVGRWYSPLGYEGYEATDSFFYSRSYSFMWGTSGTFLGAQLSRYLNDNMMLMAGIHRGADQFDDTDGKNSPGFVGGGSWWSDDECTWLDIYVLSDESGPGTNNFAYSVMAGTRIGCYDYMIEGNSGYDYGQNGGEWYGINQHLTRQLNEKWAAGMRFEWFRDDDGNLIQGFRNLNFADGPFIGNFYELTFAVNYTPCCNFSLRPEVRWDWYDPDQSGGPQPFDDQTRNNQFLVSLDAIYVF